LFFSGRRLSVGVDRLADFLGGITQGRVQERQFNERSVPTELARLVRLTNKVLSPSVDASATGPLPKSPSLDEVLQAQKVAESPVEISDLKFEGITDGGSIGVTSEVRPAHAAARPGDGFEGPGDVAKPAAAATERAETGTAPEAPSDPPELPEAMAAIEQLDDAGADASSPPRPTETGDGEAPSRISDAASTGQSSAAGGGSAASGVAPSTASTRLPPTEANKDELGDLLDEYSSNATTVMHLSPELMSAMKQASQAMESAIPAAPGGLSHADEELAGLANSLLPASADLRESPPSPPPAETVVVDVRVPTAPQAAHYREVFGQFIETRKRCGEGIADLTYDKFVAKLEKSRTAVVAKHHCDDVRFQVYVKDGKAALKALPAR
jgi:hypothetical protein